MLGNINEKIKERMKSKTNKIITLITFLLLFLITGYNSNKVIKKITSEEKMKIEQRYESISKKLDFMNSALYDFKTSNIFKNYFFENHTFEEKQYRKIQLFDELKKRNTIYGKIGYSINVGIENEDFIFSQEGTLDRKDYYRDHGFPKNVENYERYIVKNNNKINIFFRESDDSEEVVIYWIVSLNENDFFAEIHRDLENWYITNHKDILNLGNKEETGKNIKIQEIFNEKKNDENSFSEKKIYKFYIPYFYEVLFYVQPRINILNIILYELFKVVLGIGVIYFMTLLGIYLVIKPMKQLAKKMGYMKNNNEKELEYIENKIKEVSTINEDLNYKISDLKVYQKKKKIKDFLIGITETKGISSLVEESEIFKVKKYRVIIMEIYDIDSVENIFNKFDLSKELILKYFSEDVVCEIVDIDYKSIAFILEDTFTKEELYEILKCLAVHIDRNFSLKFTVAVTDEYENLEDLPRAYRAAKKILDYKFVFKLERIIFKDDIDESNQKKYYYPIELEAKLIMRTLSSNEISVKRVLEEMFDDKYSKSIDKKYLKEFGGLLYNTLGRIFIELKDMNETIEIKSFKAEELLNVKDADELKNKFEEKIFEICKATKVKDLSDTESTRIKIERYLDENYMIDISLENLADHLGHSFKYTSVLFKKVMGDNFKNYLSIYRIEKAKELMEYNKELKIKELAVLIGYNSSNTFIRIFRKYEGVSPGKYFGIGEQEGE